MGPWLAPRFCVSPTGGTKKWQEGPRGMGMGCQTQWDLEAAWEKKVVRLMMRLGSPPEASAFLVSPALSLVGSWGPWLPQTLLVSPTGGTPKLQEGPLVTGTGCHAFRKTLSKPMKESGKAEEKAGVLSWRPEPSQQPLLWALGARGVPGLHPGCMSLSQGKPQSSKQALVVGDWMAGFKIYVEAAHGKQQ